MAEKQVSYKDAFTELEAIAVQLESEDTDIDDLTRLSKRAKKLLKYCKSRLRAAEEELEK